MPANIQNHQNLNVFTKDDVEKNEAEEENQREDELFKFVNFLSIFCLTFFFLGQNFAFLDQNLSKNWFDKVKIGQNFGHEIKILVSEVKNCHKFGF